MPSPTQAELRDELLAEIESHVTDSARLGAIRERVGSADLDEDDRESLLDRIEQYRLNLVRWDQEALPADQQDPEAGGFV